MEEDKKIDDIAMISFFILNAILMFKPDISGYTRFVLVILLWIVFYRLLPNNEPKQTNS